MPLQKKKQKKPADESSIEEFAKLAFGGLVGTAAGPYLNARNIVQSPRDALTRVPSAGFTGPLSAAIGTADPYLAVELLEKDVRLPSVLGGATLMNPEFMGNALDVTSEDPRNQVRHNNKPMGTPKQLKPRQTDSNSRKLAELLGLL
jgi:hypothetical protein